MSPQKEACHARNTASDNAAPSSAPLFARRCAGHVHRLGRRCGRHPLSSLAAAQNAAETRSLLEAWAAQYACGGFYNWAVVRRADSVPMGAIGAVPAEDGAGLMEPGLCSGPPPLGAGLRHRGADRCGALSVRKRGAGGAGLLPRA